MFEYHTAIKNNEGDLFILKWKDCQDTLLNNKNTAQTVYRLCYPVCEKKIREIKIYRYAANLDW